LDSYRTGEDPCNDKKLYYPCKTTWQSKDTENKLECMAVQDSTGMYTYRTWEFSLSVLDTQGFDYTYTYVPVNSSGFYHNTDFTVRTPPPTSVPYQAPFIGGGTGGNEPGPGTLSVTVHPISSTTGKPVEPDKDPDARQGPLTWTGIYGGTDCETIELAYSKLT
jgi:hypothetical protein